MELISIGWNSPKCKTLQSRRMFSDKIVNDRGPELHNQFQFRRNPYSKRSNNVSTVPTDRTEFGLCRCLINRLQRNFNNIVQNPSILNSNLSQFKQETLNLPLWLWYHFYCSFNFYEVFASTRKLWSQDHLVNNVIGYILFCSPNKKPINKIK